MFFSSLKPKIMVVFHGNKAWKISVYMLYLFSNLLLFNYSVRIWIATIGSGSSYLLFFPAIVQKAINGKNKTENWHLKHVHGFTRISFWLRPNIRNAEFSETCPIFGSSDLEMPAKRHTRIKSFAVRTLHFIQSIFFVDQQRRSGKSLCGEMHRRKSCDKRNRRVAFQRSHSGSAGSWQALSEHHENRGGTCLWDASSWRTHNCERKFRRWRFVQSFLMGQIFV